MTQPKPRVILIGAGPTSLSALESLLPVCDVAALFRESSLDDVGAQARAAGVPVTHDMSAGAIEAAVVQLQPDCVVISSYNRILPPKLLALCRFVNVHYSPLPRYRGRANVNWAIINQDSCAALSIHVVAPGLDEGNILFQQLIPMTADDTVSDVYSRLNEIQQRQLGAAVCAYAAGFEGTPQVHAHATYGCTRLPEDGEIHWSAGANEIHALIRALQPPYPSAYTYLDCSPVAILSAEVVRDAPVYAGRIPGRVVLVNRKTGAVDVLAGDGILRILEVSVKEGERLSAGAVLRSTKCSLGLRSRQLLLKIERLEQQVKELSEHVKGFEQAISVRGELQC